LKDEAIPVSKIEMQKLVEEIAGLSRALEDVRLMEVCGTHTVSLFRSGVRSVLPESLSLVSGPGCPVCVTSQGYIDAAIEAARKPDVTICTYGDMIRVPGREGSLEACRAKGADIVVCYSIRDALRHAKENPDRTILFLAVGFETTAPATALAVLEAEQAKLSNFTVLCGHKLVMPALRTLLSCGEVPVNGFLLPGHVSVIIGSDAYHALVEDHGKACVVAGFEPEQLLLGIRALLGQIASKTARVENVYGVAVSPRGNPHALACMDRVFIPGDTVWRAMGTIPDSGLELREAFERFDARVRLDLEIGEDYDPPGCRCGEVIQGKANPEECPLFGTTCTHENPIGPCMVSSEGTCAAWYRYAGVKK
jgi:hydrogenase expression/formation protein HypD